MRRTVGLLVALQVVFWAAFVAVKPNNFGGIDEWLLLHLVSKGIVSFPYANRSLSLIWLLPAHWSAPSSLDAYRWLSGSYVSFTGVVVFWLCRRLAPRDAALAVLGSAFTMLWAPTDLMRLSTIQGTVHLGFGFGTFLAVALLIESWSRRSLGLLAAATAAALVTILSYEGVLPLLGLAPLLLPWRQRTCRAWVIAWLGVVALGATLALLPRSGASQEYQAYLGLDPRPISVGARLATQYWLHLAPLVSGFPPPAATAVVPTLVVMAATMMAAVGQEEAAVLRRLAAAGAIAAGLAYAPYTLTAGIQGAMRTQILSAPGIALLLSAAITLGGLRLGSARRGATALVGAWIVFLGASHLAAMQSTWDRYGSFPAQQASLVQLVAKVPDVKPHTLIVLVGEQRAWPMAFGFHHAVAYLYQDRAAGTVLGVEERPYPVRFGPSGITVTPWTEIQGPWREPATIYGYHEVIVAALGPSGTLEVLSGWPSSLPSLPASASYQPFSRIVSGGAEIPARAVLR
jgi:hypothetical protein